MEHKISLKQLINTSLDGIMSEREQIKKRVTTLSHEMRIRAVTTDHLEELGFLLGKLEGLEVGMKLTLSVIKLVIKII